MAVTDVKEIHLLPPLAIGRFGDSAEPMHNYEAVINNATGYRDLVPADTLMVNPTSGEIVQKFRPPAVRFKDGAGRIKPVCPFLEVWALFDQEAELRPLTLAELTDLKRGPEHVSWDVAFGNLKMLRRTGDPGDRVQTQVPPISDHDRHRLAGRAANFKADRSVHFGWVQYVKPTPAFPEIRFRFTPPPGQVYGARQDTNVTTQNAVYDATRGTWPGHVDQAGPITSPDPRAHRATSPSFIYARNPSDRTGRSLGYFDDSSDGIVTVTLTLQDGRKLSSFARASAGPPAFAPDSQPVRSMADELEQMTLGPFVADVTVEEVLDIVRRAVETMRLIDTVWWNQNYAGNAFDSDRAAYRNVHDIHTSLLATLATGLAAAANSDARKAAYDTLKQIDTVLREYDAVADRRRAARQHMPALMKGADGNDLALNRRQRSKLRRALKVFAPTPTLDQVAAMTRLIDMFQAMAGLHARFVEDNRSLADRFADPPAVLDYLRKAVAKGSVATAAGLAGKPLVVAGDPQNSAFLLTISRPEHPMNGPISSYRDSLTSKTGLQVIGDWIASLGPGV
jgi:hypothetical protein